MNYSGDMLISLHLSCLRSTMRILVTGASGFIASYIVTDLIFAGHHVTCCVRNIQYAKSIFPNACVIACDFINDTHQDDWTRRLKNIDLVINCVGIFHHPHKKIIWAIHYDTPRALFDACVKVGIKKIIQISALGVDKSDVEYAKSKKAADDYLIKLPIQSIILRPSLVYGQGSYGGTSLFRGLAGLPKFIPVPGQGQQHLQPIHVQDLSKSILRLIEKPLETSTILNVVGPQQLPVHTLLSKIRAWLGFSKAKLLPIPLWLLQIISWVGNLIPYSVINSTSYRMLIQDSITTREEAEKFFASIEFIPRDFMSGLYSHPSTVQDHWHARLFFLKPLLQSSIAFIWLFTGMCSLFFYPKAGSYSLLAHMGINTFWQPVLLYGASVLDIAIGFALLISYHLKRICQLQLIIILFYTALITWKLPHLWLEPFAPIAKNIPLLVAILIFLAMEPDR